MNVAVITDEVPGRPEGTSAVAAGLIATLPGVGTEVAAISLSRSYVDLASFRKLLETGCDAAIYVPRSGLTRAALTRARLLRAGVPRLALQVLQADATVRQPRGALRPDMFVCPSARLGRRLSPSSIVRLGVDKTRFSPTGPRDALLWPDRDGPRLLHVGHVRPSRNVEMLAVLARRGANVLLVGSPATPEDPSARRVLDDAGVTVHRGLIDDLPSLYRGADLYVFPVVDSRGCIETPLSVLEALACGTPTVATQFGSLPEASIPGLTLVTRERFVEAVCAALARPRSVDVGAVPDVAETAADVATVLTGLCERRRPSHLVAFVGIDGTGKSTQADRLVKSANARGVAAVTVWARWDPVLVRPLMSRVKTAALRSASRKTGRGESHLMAVKRRIFRSPIARSTWQFVASFDHALQTIPRVRTARRAADLVIVDRYVQDALVDMGANFGSEAPAPRAFFRLFPRPDKVIVFDAPADVAFRRKADVPSISYLQERRRLYLELAEREGWPVVDASRDADTVEAEVASIVRRDR